MWPRWLSASIVSPEPMAASPTQTAIRCRRAGSAAGRTSRAAARPTPMLTPVPACPPSKTSCSLSDRRGKPPMPSIWRSVSNRSHRFVSSLCAYAWCPVSHTIRSRGESITRCSASVISTAPSELARCPPVWWTVRIIFSRSSRARVSSCSGVRSWSCAGSRIVSSSVKETAPPEVAREYRSDASPPSDERLLEDVTALDSRRSRYVRRTDAHARACFASAR